MEHSVTYADVKFAGSKPGRKGVSTSHQTGTPCWKSISLISGLAVTCLILLGLFLWKTYTCSSHQNVEIKNDCVSTHREFCPAEWILLNHTCYYLSEEKKNKEESRERCVSINSQLAAVIPNNTLIRRIIQLTSEEYWVSLSGSDVWQETLLKDKSQVKWADGTRESIINNGMNGYSCAKLGRHLGTENCYKELRYICEKDPFLEPNLPDDVQSANSDDSTNK